jgi:membrane protein DedA with SNARE-associated domain
MGGEAPLAWKSLTSPAKALNHPVMGARRYLFFAAVGVFLLSFFEIFDFVELPFESALGHVFASGTLLSTGLLTSAMTSYGYAGLFALMALESASLPIPSEVVLPFAGFLVFQGRMNLGAAVAVSAAAGLAGALVDYIVARRVGRPLVVKLLRLSGSSGGDQLARAETWLNERGSWSVLLARFVPGIRSAVSLPAGMVRMKLKTFATMTLVGVLGWSLILILLGYYAGNLWESAVGRSGPLFMTLTLYGAAIVSILYIWRYLTLSRRPALRELERASGTA